MRRCGRAYCLLLVCLLVTGVTAGGALAAPGGNGNKRQGTRGKGARAGQGPREARPCSAALSLSAGEIHCAFRERRNSAGAGSEAGGSESNARSRSAREPSDDLRPDRIGSLHRHLAERDRGHERTLEAPRRLRRRGELHEVRADAARRSAGRAACDRRAPSARTGGRDRGAAARKPLGRPTLHGWPGALPVPGRQRADRLGNRATAAEADFPSPTGGRRTRRPGRGPSPARA